MRVSECDVVSPLRNISIFTFCYIYYCFEVSYERALKYVRFNFYENFSHEQTRFNFYWSSQQRREKLCETTCQIILCFLEHNNAIDATVAIRFKCTFNCWFTRSRPGDFSLSDVSPSGRPTEVIDNDELGSLIESNPRQTVQDLANRFGASWPTVQEHRH